MATAVAQLPKAGKASQAGKSEEKPVAKGKEPLWSRTGLIIMVVVWMVTIGLGLGGVLLFASAPSATSAGLDKGKGQGARAYGIIERVQVAIPDQEGGMRTVSFNLLLDFGERDAKLRPELEQANFKAAISYQAEELLRGYSARQVAERNFAREFGAALRKHLNELYSRDGTEYVREVLVQNLSISG